MASQDDTCWSCGAVWDYGSSPRSALRVVPGSLAADPGGGDQSSAPTVIGAARAVAEATPNLDRLGDEGDRLGADGSRRIGAQIAASR